MDIPGWFDFADLYDAALERAPYVGAHFVECGTFFGASAHYLASRIHASGKHVRFDTWDNWLGVPADDLHPGWLGPPLEEVLVRRTLAGLPVRVCTGDALAAAQVYAEQSLDLVFLDDDHQTDHVRAECAAWWPTIKAGGWLAGHDYDWVSVREGVQQWAQQTGVIVETFTARTWRIIK